MATRDALRGGTSPAPYGRTGSTADADTEFIGGAWDEAAPVTLDFDDEASSRSLHEREPEDDFAALDDDPPQRVGADVAGLAERADGGGYDGYDEDEDGTDGEAGPDG